MRFLVLGFAAVLLMLPVSRQAVACGYHASAQATAVDLSAEEKKKPKKKVAMKKKHEKVEYMRAAPMPPGAK